MVSYPSWDSYRGETDIVGGQHLYPTLVHEGRDENGTYR